jgi:aerobic carbon-monoxide dehydrogenase small subunit
MIIPEKTLGRIRALVLNLGQNGVLGVGNMAQISMTVNVKAMSGEVEGRTRRSAFLRDTLGLTGTHVGCDTGQCGACTPGMVKAEAALLKENSKPSEAEIRRYLSGNLCRCTGYHNIVKAILAASGQAVAKEFAA